MKSILTGLTFVCLLALITPATSMAQTQMNAREAIQLAPEAYRWQIAQVLDRAGDNQAELIQALAGVDASQREGMAFLIAYMPEQDITTLTAEFLIENSQLAYEAKANCPWSDEIDPQHFLQYILPYACTNERRDNWRRDFYDKLREQAWQFETPLEASIWLNDEFENLFGVTFHATRRPKPDQSPYESIEARYASCTGLSILMIDACRAVGIPARFVGVPLWTEIRGNHNWVEVFDGQWHNIGSSGTDPRDDDWVDDRCRNQTDPDAWEHSVYAACWRDTTLWYPMVWNMNDHDVPALNITRFYSHKIEHAMTLSSPATVKVYWADELVVRMSGEGEMALPLTTGSTFEIVIEYEDGSEERQTLRT